LSPWSRRALVAGGFGYGASCSKCPREIAPIIPSFDSETEKEHYTGDIETGDVKVQVRDEEEAAELRNWEPLLPQETPFFHLDLQSAIRAAESGLERLAAFDYKKELERNA
jgi:sodium-independent sulfate anion transporter 11